MLSTLIFAGGRPAERRQGKNGKGKGKPDSKKKENVTPMDLDVEMDKCTDSFTSQL